YVKSPRCTVTSLGPRRWTLLDERTDAFPRLVGRPNRCTHRGSPTKVMGPAHCFIEHPFGCSNSRRRRAHELLPQANRFGETVFSRRHDIDHSPVPGNLGGNRLTREHQLARTTIAYLACEIVHHDRRREATLDLRVADPSTRRRDSKVARRHQAGA